MTQISKLHRGVREQKTISYKLQTLCAALLFEGMAFPQLEGISNMPFLFLLTHPSLSSPVYL